MSASQDLRGVECARLFAGLVLAVAVVLASGCKSKPSATSSARLERAMSSSANASKRLTDGMKLLMDSVSKPSAPFHLTYKAEKNINDKYMQEPQAKPVLGAMALEAEIGPDSISFTETKGEKKSSTKAARSDQLAWSMAQLGVMGTLLDPNFALAVGGVAAQSAGSDTVGGAGAEKFDFNTATAPASAQAGIQMAMSMLGGRVKFESVKGSAWVDRASGMLVKFNIDTELSDKAGNKWKEHQEAEITPK